MPIFDFTLSLPMSSVVSQKFDEEVIVPLSSFPRKGRVLNPPLPGFWLARAIASLAGMMRELCSELKGQDTSLKITKSAHA
jgi:hypothetical protein